MPVTVPRPKELRRLRTLVLWVNVILALALAAFLGWRFGDIETTTGNVLGAQSAFWSDAMNQRYASIQTVCNVTREKLGAHPSLWNKPEAAQPWIDGFLPQLPFVSSIQLISAQGRIAASTKASAQGKDVADAMDAKRELQTALSKSGKLEIGRAAFAPEFGGHLVTPVRCAVPGPASNEFGVLSFAVQTQDLLQSLRAGMGAANGNPPVPAVGLIRDDGFLLARLPPTALSTAREASNKPSRGVLARELAAHPQAKQGVISGWVPSANAHFVVAWERLAGRQVTAFVSLPRSVVVTKWALQAAPMLLGWLILLAMQAVGWRWVSRLHGRQHHLMRFNAALAALSQIAAQAKSEQELFDAACDIAVNQAGMVLAWVGCPDAEDRFVAQAVAGVAEYLDGQVISCDATTPAGRGPSGTAWRDAKPQFSWTYDDARLQPWADRAQSFGIRSIASLPIRVSGQVRALFSVYHSVRGGFEDTLRQLLGQMALELGRSLERLAIQAAERTERESRERQQEILRAILAEIDTLIAARSEAELLVSACTRLLETGMFAAAWVGQPDAQNRIKLLAAAGNGAEVLADAEPLTLQSATALQQAWQTQALALEASAASPLLTPWQAYGVPEWAQGAVVLAIRRGDEPWALLVLVAQNRDDFDDALLPMLRRVPDLLGRALAELDLKVQLKSEQSRQAYLARHDALTSLPNRLALETHLPLAMARARRHGSLLAVGLMDLDDFKPVNDTWGHPAGDELLRQLGQRLKAAVRETDLVARLGGDEFVVVLEGLARESDLPMLLDRLHGAVETPFDLGENRQAQVGMSMGLTLYPADESEPDLLLRHADAALYSSKAHKGDRSTWWLRWSEPGVDDSATIATLRTLDPYGYEVRRLFMLAQDAVAQTADAFVAQFHARLESEPQFARILHWLSTEELARLRRRQASHLRHIMTPGLREIEHRQAAAHIACQNALAGVAVDTLVSSLGWYLQQLQELAANLPGRARDRQQLAHVISARMQVELEAQTGAARDVNEHYQLALVALEHMLQDATQWADIVRTALDTVVELPGMKAAVLFQPDADGHFVPEFTAGRFDAYLQAIADRGIAPPVLDEHDSSGNTPHPRCWRSEHIETNASYVTDARMTPWRDAAHSIGIRSSAAIPVKDARGRMLGVFGLYGGMPGMFEAPDMRRFMQALELLFERASRGLHAGDATALPAEERRAWRARLFNGGLDMFVQPIVDLRSGKPEKVEALARLRLEDGRIITPGQFLPWFGAAELIRLFTLGLEQTLGHLRAWDAMGLRLDASINLPPEVLLQPDCAHWVRQTLERFAISPARLQLEILEDAEFQDVGLRDVAVHALAALGVHLVMDDLGSGYSSLLRLRTLPFHVVKIDQGLVREAGRDPERVVRFIGSLVRMAHSLGLSVVVEGLETPELVEVAAVLDAEAGQGFAFAQPMPAADLHAWMTRFGTGLRADIDVRHPRTPLGRLARQWVLEGNSAVVEHGHRAPAANDVVSEEIGS